MAVARVQQPSLTAEELLATLAEQFRLPPQEAGGLDPASRVNCISWPRKPGQGRAVLVLVDEAHRASAPCCANYWALPLGSPRR